jgi:hypothetical protein
MHFNKIKIEGYKIGLITFLDLVCFKESTKVNYMVGYIGVPSDGRMFTSCSEAGRESFEIQGRFRWCVINEEHLLLKGNGGVKQTYPCTKLYYCLMTKPRLYLH